MDNKTKFDGASAIDDRGKLSFVNDFDPVTAGVRRFYVVENHEQGFVRAWHGHINEGKYVFVVSGAIKLGVVPNTEWGNPDFVPQQYILSAEKPCVVYIPPGNANGFMNLTADTKVMFFSTSTLEESKGDDYRFKHDMWNIWNIERR